MAQQRNIKKVVLAYSGGLDTSVILKWLQVNYGCEVITMTADVGQEDDLNGVDEKALRTGATKAYIEDLREEFAKDFIFPMPVSYTHLAERSSRLFERRQPLVIEREISICPSKHFPSGRLKPTATSSSAARTPSPSIRAGI